MSKTTTDRKLVLFNFRNKIIIGFTNKFELKMNSKSLKVNGELGSLKNLMLFEDEGLIQNLKSNASNSRVVHNHLLLNASPENQAGNHEKDLS